MPYAYNPWMENIRNAGSMIPSMTATPPQAPGLDPTQMGLLTQQGYPSTTVGNMTPEDLRYMTQQDPKQQIMAAIAGALQQMGTALAYRGRGPAGVGVPNIPVEETAGGRMGAMLAQKRSGIIGQAQDITKEKRQMEAFMKQFGMEQGGREKIQGMSDVASMARTLAPIGPEGAQARQTAEFTSNLPQRTNIEPMMAALTNIGIPPELARSIVERHLANFASPGTEAGKAMTTANAAFDNAIKLSTVTSTFGGSHIDHERLVKELSPLKTGQPSDVQNIINQQLAHSNEIVKYLNFARDAIKAGKTKEEVVPKLLEITGLNQGELPQDLK